MSSKRDVSRLTATKMMPLLLFFCVFFSCGRSKDKPGNEDILVMTPTECLLKSEVEMKIPPGISYTDSIALFDELVENWIKEKVMLDFAQERLPDFSFIERKVSQYRTRLIIREYLKGMQNNQIKGYSPDEKAVREYYESHLENFRSELPFVKGILVTVPSSSKDIAQIKESLYEASDSSLDMLERTYLSDALQYQYFMDRWIDWQSLADNIPYRFVNPDIFLEDNKDFETSYNDITYILHINEYLPTGSLVPYDYARTEIEDVFLRKNMEEYEEELVSSLIKQAIDDKKIELHGYELKKK